MIELTKSFIRKTPGVQGGAACIRNFRIPVWGIISFRRLGCDDAKILDAYPTLTLDDLDAVADYYASHQKKSTRKSSCRSLMILNQPRNCGRVNNCY